MILKIDTTITNALAATLLKNGVVLAEKRVEAPRRQAELLLPTIIELLAEQKITPQDINTIEVVASGGSFTSLRIGVLTANALAYAWGKKLVATTAAGEDISAQSLKDFGDYQVVVPQYEAEPNIGKTQKDTKRCK